MLSILGNVILDAFSFFIGDIKSCKHGRKGKKTLTSIFHIHQSWFFLTILPITASELNVCNEDKYIVVNLGFWYNWAILFRLFHDKKHRGSYICVHDFIFTCPALNFELPLCIYLTTWIFTYIASSGTVVWTLIRWYILK